MFRLWWLIVDLKWTSIALWFVFAIIDSLAIHVKMIDLNAPIEAPQGFVERT